MNRLLRFQSSWALNHLFSKGRHPLHAHLCSLGEQHGILIPHINKSALWPASLLMFCWGDLKNVPQPDDNTKISFTIRFKNTQLYYLSHALSIRPTKTNILGTKYQVHIPRHSCTRRHQFHQEAQECSPQTDSAPYPRSPDQAHLK